MLSNKPYLIRAFYDWIVDSSCTPFMLVDACVPHCKVPDQFVEDGRIVLNASPLAIRDFSINAKVVEFRASFSGVVYLISVPLKAVIGIYAEENQQGMFFEPDEEGVDSNVAAIAAKGESEVAAVEEGWRDEGVSLNDSSQQAVKKKDALHLRLVE